MRGVTEQTGPSMSTEPGWTDRRAPNPSLLGATRTGGANDASMLLSFERPASAVLREDASSKDATAVRGAGRREASPRSLKTAQKPHQPPSISGG